MTTFGQDADLAELVGAKILSIGEPVGPSAPRASLALRYIPKGEAVARTLVMSFNDLGLTDFRFE